MQNENLINLLLEHNKKRSGDFSNSDTVLARRLYRAQHPTEIAALKCMDGRLHLPIITQTPLGIIQPFRNIGGHFDLGWPFFGLVMKEWVEYTIAKGKNSIVLTTYHYSKSDSHLGCKGFGYKDELALSETKKLKEQFERVFGVQHSVVYPILVGIETDEDTLIIHGDNGEVMDMSTMVDSSVEDIRKKTVSLFPQMRPEIIDDLLPLLIGNANHIKAIREKQRPITEINHKEFVLAVGRGFDWLHFHNKALIIGPYSYNLKDPVGKGAGILLDNIKQGRVEAGDGVLLMTSAVYRDEVGLDAKLAVEKAISLANFSLETIREQVPELLPYISVLVGTTNMNTREFNRIPFTFSGE